MKIKLVEINCLHYKRSQENTDYPEKIVRTGYFTKLYLVIWLHVPAQSARVVEYTDHISSEG